jgi:hypothetical protein
MDDTAHSHSFNNSGTWLAIKITKDCQVPLLKECECGITFSSMCSDLLRGALVLVSLALGAPRNRSPIIRKRQYSSSCRFRRLSVSRSQTQYLDNLRNLQDECVKREERDRNLNPPPNLYFINRLSEFLAPCGRPEVKEKTKTTRCQGTHVMVF